MKQVRVPLVDPVRLPDVAVEYPVESRLDDWWIPEGRVPQATDHDQAILRFRLLLDAWVARTGRDALVATELAIRYFREHPRSGVDPDVCLLEPAPPRARQGLGSVKLWQEGHLAPAFSLEVVSLHHPNKDYGKLPFRYAAMDAIRQQQVPEGSFEIAVFDPKLSGPRSLGGPFSLQLWRRSTRQALERVAAGSEPAYSEVLAAWLIPDGLLLHIANDREGHEPWRTAEEAERAAKEAALREIAELRAELARRG